MFRFKSIIVVLFLVSCGSPKKKDPIKFNKTNCTKVINKTDSILSYAEGKMVQIKQNKIEQRVFVDSLKSTIEAEQYTINDLNREVRRIKIVDEELQLTKQELEQALLRCQQKEKKLQELNKEFALKSEKFMDEIGYYVDREVKLITSYSHKVDSLEKVIESLKKVSSPIENVSKKKKRKRN